GFDLERSRRPQRPDVAVPQSRLVRLLLVRGGARPAPRGPPRRGRRPYGGAGSSDALAGEPTGSAHSAAGAPRVSRYAVHRSPGGGRRAPHHGRTFRPPRPTRRLGCGEPAEASRGRAHAQGARVQPGRTLSLAPGGCVAVAVPSHRGRLGAILEGNQSAIQEDGAKYPESTRARR